MDYGDIKARLAPCGLDCFKCFAYSGGEIKRLSAGLEDALGAFDNYAKRFSSFMPVFANYPFFKELLSFLTQSDCRGCRSGDCKYPNCGVAPCAGEKGVDYCFQCGEFPCGKSRFDPDLERRWIAMNRRMKDIGVEAYYDETKDLPRYG